MLWRGSARLGGIGGVDFNVLGNLAELVRKFEVNADIAVFVNLDVVYQVREDFTGQNFDALILCKDTNAGYSLSTPFASSARSAVSRASTSVRSAACRS